VSSPDLNQFGFGIFCGFLYEGINKLISVGINKLISVGINKLISVGINKLISVLNTHR
jgi:hypothetical protein